MHVEDLVDLVLDGQAVAVPAEPAFDLMVGLVGPATDHVLYCACQNVALVGHARGEGWAVLKCKFLFTF